jgi:pseudaminic acid biosynthesis-associated methylase
MSNYRTDQEEFWAGDFGNEYVERNRDAKWLASNIHLFSQVLEGTSGIRSVIEFGCNIGLNLLALRSLLPDIQLSGVEINSQAFEQLQQIAGIKAYRGSILDFSIDQQRDLSLVKGVLIHINPAALSQVYTLLYESTTRYICIAEYYNPSPVAIAYRGHEDRLFKRDFAGEMLDKYPELRLVDYEFCYRRDRNFPQDDLTWFLLEKT